MESDCVAKRWTKEEIEFLKNNCEGKTYLELAELMPNRTRNAIEYKCRDLDLNELIQYGHYEHWTKKEMDIILHNYPNSTNKYIQTLLPDRTSQSILNQANRMGVFKNTIIAWDSLDVEILKNLYNRQTKDVNKIYILLNKKYTKEEIKRKIKELFPKIKSDLPIKKESLYKHWSESEVSLLKANEGKHIDEISKLIPNRSTKAVISKLDKMGIKFTRRKVVNLSKNDMSILNYYKRKGIYLDTEKFLDTYSVYEWHEMMLQNKIKTMPHKLYTEENKKLLLKYVIEELLGYKTRDEVKNINLKQLSEYKIHLSTYPCNSLYELINYVYPNYNLHPWEFSMTGITCFRDKENIVKAIDWMLEESKLDYDDILNIHNHIDCSVEDLFAKYGLSTLITNAHFNGYHNLFDWYFKQKEIPLSKHDFYYKQQHYWKSKENADYQMKKYMGEIISIEGLANINKNISRYFTNSYMEDNGFIMLSVCIGKYKHYKSFCEWVNYLYENLTLDEKDFKTYISCDGRTICDSYEEKLVFDYIYSDLNLKNIKSIGGRRLNGFYNNTHKETYYPDFVIKDLLDKPIYIEYYGLYNIYSKHIIFTNYVKKTKRKNEFYESNDDIYFIDLYPEDLKNDFEGVRKKLTSFFNIKERK